ncbi:MAG: hypothetical protein EXX96DRAFT_579778 [Benjaminiella poitrasii]|nr:MAG: hypothetical protein EXX96DRAFT_579778 [Benjaminiella poitrasii]
MQEIYSNPQHRYRICLCINVFYGGPLVCFIWLVVNAYACVLSFQKRSPIYSYLNSTALIIQGIVCLLFFIISLLSLYSFSLNRSRQLRKSHILIWLIVIIFLIVYFVNLILFGLQKSQFRQWCINKARDTTSNYLFTHTPSNETLLPDSQLTFTPRGDNNSLYNCTRLWEDEMKLSAVVFVILLVTYIHAALCFRYHTYERFHIEQDIMAQMANNAMLQNGNMMMPNNTNPTTMMNIAPEKMDNSRLQEDNGQKSLAQIVRAAFSRLR